MPEGNSSKKTCERPRVSPVRRCPVRSDPAVLSEYSRDEMRVRVLHVIGEGAHGTYDPRALGAVDRLLDTMYPAEPAREDRLPRAVSGASGDADARSRSPRRDRSTNHHRHSRTRQWVPRVIVQTSAVGETHTTIYY